MARIWIVLTIGFGVVGGPGGASIAWIAHIGGFLAGMGLGNFLIKRKR
jgi:membrane associated rhomboid family serine protease